MVYILYIDIRKLRLYNESKILLENLLIMGCLYVYDISAKKEAEKERAWV